MARNVKVPLAGSLTCLGALALLALAVYSADSVQQIDTAVLARLVVDPGSRAEQLAAGLAQLGDLPVLLPMLALACAIGLLRRRPKRAVAALIVVAGANVTTQMLKALLAHPRVQLALGADQVAWNSFPSGHVTAAASIAIAFAFVLPRRLLPAVVALGSCLVAVVGCAVLVLAWHYPTDLLGGILVTPAWGLAALAALRWSQPKLPAWRLSWVDARPSP